MYHETSGKNGKYNELSDIIIFIPDELDEIKEIKENTRTIIYL